VADQDRVGDVVWCVVECFHCGQVVEGGEVSAEAAIRLGAVECFEEIVQTQV